MNPEARARSGVGLAADGGADPSSLLLSGTPRSRPARTKAEYSAGCEALAWISNAVLLTKSLYPCQEQSCFCCIVQVSLAQASLPCPISCHSHAIAFCRLPGQEPSVCRGILWPCDSRIVACVRVRAGIRLCLHQRRAGCDRLILWADAALDRAYSRLPHAAWRTSNVLTSHQPAMLIRCTMRTQRYPHTCRHGRCQQLISQRDSLGPVRSDRLRYIGGAWPTMHAFHQAFGGVKMFHCPTDHCKDRRMLHMVTEGTPNAPTRTSHCNSSY